VWNSKWSIQILGLTDYTQRPYFQKPWFGHDQSFQLVWEWKSNNTAAFSFIASLSSVRGLVTHGFCDSTLSLSYLATVFPKRFDRNRDSDLPTKYHLNILNGRWLDVCQSRLRLTLTLGIKQRLLHSQLSVNLRSWVINRAHRRQKCCHNSTTTSNKITTTNPCSHHYASNSRPIPGVKPTSHLNPRHATRASFRTPESGCGTFADNPIRTSPIPLQSCSPPIRRRWRMEDLCPDAIPIHAGSWSLERSSSVHDHTLQKYWSKSLLSQIRRAIQFRGQSPASRSLDAMAQATRSDDGLSTCYR